MKSQTLQIALVSLLVIAPGAAQVVSVKCCISEGNLIRIGECLSGPEPTEAPPACGSIATCVLGYGADTALMPQMCAPDQPDLPDEPRAICSSWVADNVPVTRQCVASANTDFSPFDIYDADRDGDLDLRDIAVFQQIYESVPNEVQSEARLVFVECCTPGSEQGSTDRVHLDSEIATDTLANGSLPVCTLGFSGALGPGDYLYELCRPGAAPKSSSTGTECFSWSVDGVPVVQRCEALNPSDYRCPPLEDQGERREFDPAGAARSDCSHESPSRE